MTLRSLLRAALALALIAALAAAYAATRSPAPTVPLGANGCPPGYASKAERLAQARREKAAEQRDPRRAEVPGRDRGTDVEMQVIALGAACVTRKRPEGIGELMSVQTEDAVRSTGGLTDRLRPGAYRAALRERKRIAASGRSVAGSAGEWTPAGKGPLINDDERFTEVNTLGLGEIAGRISDFALGGGERVYAAVGEGGVYASDDGAQTWRSIGDTLPTQAVGSVDYSPANGGTIIASTGDSVFGGGGTFAGLGVYRTTDGGASWQHSTGVPDGVISFKVRVDPSDPQVVYAATGAGLFRSTDAGATFTNVALPTGEGVPEGEPDCTGAPVDQEGCYFANMVTDVVVQAPGGTTEAEGGRVLATVGWRSADKRNKSKAFPDGYAESPNNGFYASETGEPGTFEKLSAAGIDPSAKIGRVELGAATGPEQNHDVVYAIIEDAARFNGEPPGIDQPNTVPGLVTVLDGIYASTDFGESWERLADAAELQLPTSGSALTGTFQAQGYAPGIQSWYNLWIAPDPTRQDGSGVPTRLLFGLEEVWQNDVLPRGAQDETATFKVVGRYFGGKTCLALDNPAGTTCPTDREPRDEFAYTTHADQHAGIFLPRPDGGVRAIVGHDGGVNVQDRTAEEADFSNNAWGRGANQGFETLLPYDAQIAKDGTIYAGLQDNGELKIEPDGRQYGVFGGDGAFSAVDPDDSKIAYEAYTYNDMAKTVDGGQTFEDVAEPADEGYQFINPFTMDPLSSKHLLTAGNAVHETNDGAGNWTTVFDLGTQKAPGTDTAASAGDPINQVTGVDVRSLGKTGAGPLKKTADVAEYEAGGDTVPDPVNPTVGTGVDAPGTYHDQPFTIAPDESNASATIDVTWGSDGDDWDLAVLRSQDGELVEVGSSAQGETTFEKVVLTAPDPGDYVVRVKNFAATGTFKGKVTFAPALSAPSGEESAGYVSFCGYCDALNDETRPVASGIATNVSPDGKVGKKLAEDNWHIAKAEGLPERYLTSVQIDPNDVRTVYVTVAGYSRRWLPPGVLGEEADLRPGSVFKSTDAGETFRNISGNLPDAPANWTLVRNGQLLVATNAGVYISSGTDGGEYELLGSGLPAAPVFTLELKPKARPDEPDTLVAATQGRGVYRYEFRDPAKTPPADRPGTPPAGDPPTATPPVGEIAPRCRPSGGLASVSAVRRGRGVRLGFTRRTALPVTVDVFRVSQGRRVVKERLIARFRDRASSFTWNGVSNQDGKRKRVGTGYYFVRYAMLDGRRRIDVRRVVLRRARGRFSQRPDFFRRDRCDLIAKYKLERPVFGGPRGVTLKGAYQLAEPARVTVTILKGTKVVRRYAPTSRAARRTYRFSLPAGRRARGDYRVRLVAVAAGRRLTATLTSRKL